MSSRKAWQGPIDGKLAVRQCLKRWMESQGKFKEHPMTDLALPRGMIDGDLWIGDGFVAYKLAAGKDQQNADDALRADGIKRSVEPNDVLAERIPKILALVPEAAPERKLTRLALRWSEYFSVLFAGAGGFDMVDTRFLEPLDDTGDTRWRWRQATKGGPIVGAFRGEDTVILMPMHLANGDNEGELLWNAWKSTQRQPI